MAMGLVFVEVPQGILMGVAGGKSQVSVPLVGVEDFFSFPGPGAEHPSGQMPLQEGVAGTIQKDSKLSSS